MDREQSASRFYQDTLAGNYQPQNRLREFLFTAKLSSVLVGGFMTYKFASILLTYLDR